MKLCMPANQIRSHLRKLTLKSIYSRVFFALLALTLLTILVLGAVVYTLSASALTDQINREKSQSLRQTRASADAILKEIERIVVSASNDPRLERFATDPRGDENKQPAAAIAGLREVKNASRYIHSVYVYAPLHHLIITSEDGQWNFDEFYDRAWTKDISRHEEISWLSPRHVQTTTGDNADLVSLVVPMPIGKQLDGNDVLLVCNLSEQVIQQVIASPDSSEAENAFVVNADGRLISHHNKNLLGQPLSSAPGFAQVDLDQAPPGFPVQAGSDRFLTFQVQSKYNDWRYVTLVPQADIAGPIAHVRRLILIMAGVWALAATAASILVSSLIYKPIAAVVRNVQKYAGSLGMDEQAESTQDEMSFLDRSCGLMVERNRALSAAFEACQAILQATRASESATQKKEGESTEVILSVVEYLQKNYNQDIHLPAVADSVYLSPWYLSRRFHEETGKTFMEYLTQLRIESAKVMLRDPSHRIADIAAAVNLGNAGNFIKIFKKYTGVTPGQYRDGFRRANLGLQVEADEVVQV